MPTVYTERELPKRAEYDFYPTPEAHVAATLEAVEVAMVCPARPSFTGNGLVAPNEYAVVVWRRGWTGETRLVWSRKAR